MFSESSRDRSWQYHGQRRNGTAEQRDVTPTRNGAVSANARVPLEHFRADTSRSRSYSMEALGRVHMSFARADVVTIERFSPNHAPLGASNVHQGTALKASSG